MTIQSLDASSASPALMRSILLSVIGEEDSTCIVKINDEERRASETYVLSGRRLPAGSQRGLVIITLKIGGKWQKPSKNLVENDKIIIFAAVNL